MAKIVRSFLFPIELTLEARRKDIERFRENKTKRNGNTKELFHNILTWDLSLKIGIVLDDDVK